MAVHARDVDDHAAAFDEVWERGTGRADRGHQVQLEHLRPVRVGLVGEACGETSAADVVDEDVQCSQPRDRLVDSAFGGAGLRHVQLKVRETREGVRGGAARADYAGALGQETGRTREPNPLTHTGDERDLTFQTQIHEPTLDRLRGG